MWRTVLIDEALRTRVRKAVLRLYLTQPGFLIAAAFTTLMFGLLGLVDYNSPLGFLVGAALSLGMSWVLAGRAASQVAGGLVLGTPLAAAVTRDGALHTQSAVGVSTYFPGQVERIVKIGDIWLLQLRNRSTAYFPSELLTSSDAALLVPDKRRRLSP